MVFGFEFSVCDWRRFLCGVVFDGGVQLGNGGLIGERERAAAAVRRGQKSNVCLLRELIRHVS